MKREIVEKIIDSLTDDNDFELYIGGKSYLFPGINALYLDVADDYLYIKSTINSKKNNSNGFYINNNGFYIEYARIDMINVIEIIKCSDS